MEITHNTAQRNKKMENMKEDLREIEARMKRSGYEEISRSE